MYSDPSGHVAISLILSILGIAFAVGAGISAGVAIAHEIDENGFNLKEWDYGKIFSEALIGGTLNLAFTAGCMLGVGMVTGWAALGLFIGSSILSFGNGMLAYCTNSYFNGKSINKNIMYEEGFNLLIQGTINYGFGAFVGATGKWHQSLFNDVKEVINFAFNPGIQSKKVVAYILWLYIKILINEAGPYIILRLFINKLVDELQMCV